MAEEGMDATAGLALKEPLARFELGDGLEVWNVPMTMIREQDVNARAMASDTFLQLTETIKRQGRLESLPLCAWTGNKLELISGHHRVRAARKAELTEMWVLVDVTNLDSDWVKAKQLAHNSIQGEDNAEVVRQIFTEIENVTARIEAFIDPDLKDIDTNVALESRALDVKLDSKIVSLVFLPAQRDVFVEAIDRLIKDTDDVFLATREEYDLLVDLVTTVGDEYEIRSTPTIFAKMGEIVREALAGKEAEKDGEGN